MKVTKTLAAGLVSLSILATTAACGGSDEGPADGEMQVMMFPGVAYRLPVMVAQEKGFFDDADVKIDIIAQPNNLQGIQAIEATKSQAGMMSATTFAQGVQAGSDVKMFCGGIRYAQSAIIATADSELPSVDDGATPEEVLKALDGKKVGAQTPAGSGFQMLLEAAFDEAGVKDITWVNVGGSNSVTQASLQNGDVDAAQASPPGTQTLEENGVSKTLIYMPEHTSIYRDLYGSGWVGPTKWLDDNPETAKSFCDATAKALDYIADEANHDEVRAIFMKDTGVNDETVADAVLATYVDYSADVPVDVLEASFAKYEELGITKPEPALDATELVDTVGR
ncbi:ABC transporter substrate-binding protein [Nocardioides alcanivorans]|uniref:ABC transporter substrate-binding protein n=1 Tax=Nocardioides alcanivorans TaxID=2897352 RepID=UPI001F37FA61|nr:ABC transporter substrate-binding protein [Nocardioides alcanivorans]